MDECSGKPCIMNVSEKKIKEEKDARMYCKCVRVSDRGERKWKEEREGREMVE